MTAFRPFFNAATGEWIEYTTVAEDSEGQLVRLTWRSMPGGVISEHIHPNQEERFAIVSGEATFTVDGERRTAKAGETIVVPPGVRHSEGNLVSVEITGVVELRPALRTKNSMRPSPAWWPTAGRRRGGRRRTRFSWGPPSGTSATRVG